MSEHNAPPSVSLPPEPHPTADAVAASGPPVADHGASSGEPERTPEALAAPRPPVADRGDLSEVPEPTPEVPDHGVPADPDTGDARVDAALTRLPELDQLDVTEHAPVFEDIHRALQDTLAEEED